MVGTWVLVKGLRVRLLVSVAGLASVLSACDGNQYRESVDAPPSALTALRVAPNGDPQVWIATCGMALRDEVTLSYAPIAAQANHPGGDVSIWQIQIEGSKLPPHTKSVVLSPADSATYESTTMTFDRAGWSGARALGAVTVRVGAYHASGLPYAATTFQLSEVAAASPDFLLDDYRHKSLASLNKEAQDYCSATAGSTYPP